MANDSGDRRTEGAEIDAALDAALGRLPRRAAPAALERRIRQQFAEPTTPRRSRGWIPPLVSAFAAAALVVVAVRFVPPARDAGPGAAASAELVAEAVNDHLRVVSSSRPVEIESGGIHQVKPWFTGRLEFAPRVTFSGDDEFPLVGGSVGYFRDRKAAVFVFKRRLHADHAARVSGGRPPLAGGAPAAGGPPLGQRAGRARLLGAALARRGPRLRARLRRQPPRPRARWRRGSTPSPDRSDAGTDRPRRPFGQAEVTRMIDRRDILKLMGVGGVVFASGLAGARHKEEIGERRRRLLLPAALRHALGLRRRVEPRGAT